VASGLAAVHVWAHLNDPIVVAAVALLGVLGTAISTLRSARQDRLAQRQGEHAQQFAQALSAVMVWKELGYRVLRRTDDRPETLADVAKQFHQAQQDLDWHCTWLRIEAPEVATTYEHLVQQVKSLAAPLIRQAWKNPPIQRSEDMNLHEDYHRTFEDLDTEPYVKAVQSFLRERYKAKDKT
jgi:hypothetical protein